MKALAGSVHKLISQLLVGLITVYKWCISPVLASNCRFYPTCSEYSVIAIKKHGIFKGSWLAMKRIGRCHPWSDGGLDFVPGTEQECCKKVDTSND